jgi:predicted kinase
MSAQENLQDEVISFLSDPASYVGVDRVERFETHGNLVFLAGSEAWKIKRAVRFSYMDFSTLEKRHAACAREVEINRRFGSDLYLGCRPIARSAAGTLAFGCDGDIIEWAVHMRRFEQSALLSAIAGEAGLSNDLARLPDNAYALEARKRVYQALNDKARLVLRAGHAVIIDAVFADHDLRENVQGLAREIGVRFCGIWLRADPETLLKRVAGRHGDASDATAEVVQAQLQRDQRPFTAEWATVDAGGTVADTVARAQIALNALEGRNP